jgi:sugar/nucleoside kinase (ribokinase family)
MKAVPMIAGHSVLVAGHLCIDITPELTGVPGLVPGQLYEIGSAQLTLGGCVANTGLALAAAGVPTRVCGRVGNDPLGQIVRRLLAELGVDLKDVTTTAGAATSYTIVLQPPDHDRTFWHHPGANASFTGREVNLDGVDILHLGYPPLLPALLDDDAASLHNLLKEARSRQITTSLDLAVVDPGSRAAEVDWRRVFARIMPYVDIATPSLDDLTSALAIARTTDDDLVEECAHRLVDAGCAIAVVSAGARGAYAVSAGADRLAVAGPALSSVRSTWSSTAEWVPAAAPRLIASTTGAGDAATAGLLYGLAQGTGIRRATRLAARFAAANIEGRRPSSEEAGRWAAELAAAGFD